MELQFFFRKSKGNLKSQAGLGKIIFIINQTNHKPIERSSGISCKIEEWNDTEKCFLGTGANSKNIRLEKIKSNFETILNKSNATQDDLQYFFDSLNAPTLYLKKFIDVFDEYLAFQADKIRKNDAERTLHTIEKSTYETYIKRKNNIIQFLSLKNKSNISVTHVDGKFCEDFDLWCVNNIGGQAYSNKHLKLIRSVIRFAVKNKYITFNGTDEYKLKREPETIAISAAINLKENFANNNVFTIDTVNTISNKTIESLSCYKAFTPTEQKYVDAFLFMRETWLHIGDYLELQDKHFKIDEKGHPWIIKPRVKRLSDTGGQIQIMPLTERAVEILNVYDGKLSKLPKAQRSTFTKYLKMACLKAGITEKVTLKYARSNGISNSYNNNRLRSEMIAIGAGWTSPEPLKNYLRMDFNKLRNEMLNPQQVA